MKAITTPAYCNRCDKPTIFKHTPDNSSENYQCMVCNGFVRSLNIKHPSTVMLPDSDVLPTPYREDPRESTIAQLKHEISELRAQTNSAKKREDGIIKRAKIVALWCWLGAIYVCVFFTWKAAIMFLFIWASISTMCLILKD